MQLSSLCLSGCVSLIQIALSVPELTSAQCLLWGNHLSLANCPFCDESTRKCYLSCAFMLFRAKAQTFIFVPCIAGLFLIDAVGLFVGLQGVLHAV